MKPTTSRSDPTSWRRWPATTIASLGATSTAESVTARRLANISVADTLRLIVHHVGAVDSIDDADPGPAAVVLPTSVTDRGGVGGVRAEILDAINAVLTRSGGHTFTPAQIVAEMTRRDTGYAESTVRIMITGHLCRNAPNNAGATYDDLERVGHGHYRLAI